MQLSNIHNPDQTSSELSQIDTRQWYLISYIDDIIKNTNQVTTCCMHL